MHCTSRSCEQQLVDQSQDASLAETTKVASQLLLPHCHLTNTGSQSGKQDSLSFSINRLLQSDQLQSSMSETSLAISKSPFLFGKLLSNFSKSFTSDSTTSDSVANSETQLMTSLSWINSQLLKPGVSGWSFCLVWSFSCYTQNRCHCCNLIHSSSFSQI